jgi:hypothetical protein
MRTFVFQASQGKPDFGSDYNRAAFLEMLKENEGKKFKITPIIPKRSLSQNRYYWLYLGVIEQETGNGADDLHEYFKRKHLPPKFIEVLGQEMKIPRSTTELSKVEFGEFLEKICAETGVALPDPQLAGYLPN